MEGGQPMDQERVLASLRARLDAVYAGPNKLEKFDQVAEFGQYLRRKYPNPTQYTLFHVLAGSTLMEETPLFDFPGEDSIKKFIEEKL